MASLLEPNGERLGRRHREGAGWSDASWIKHNFVKKVVAAQVAAYRMRFPNDRLLLIDGNAGDGVGVPKLQSDLFDGTQLSHPSPQILSDLARSLGNADVCLCESDLNKRQALFKRFRTAIVVPHHSDIAGIIRREHRYALWLSDPCGPKGHGVEHMRSVKDRILCDFVIVLNERAIDRFMSTVDPCWKLHREKYGPMLEPQYWLERLGKQKLARSRLIHQSANFHYRVLVIANYLTDATRREPFIETISAHNVQGGKGHG